MIAEIENYKTGWYGIRLRFDSEEIKKLIESLQLLNEGEFGHFHFENLDFTRKEGIADIEISLKGKDEHDNMSVM